MCHGQKKADQLGGTWNNPGEYYTSLYQGGSSGRGESWFDPGYILRVDLITSDYCLDVGMR